MTRGRERLRFCNACVFFFVGLQVMTEGTAGKFWLLNALDKPPSTGTCDHLFKHCTSELAKMLGIISRGGCQVEQKIWVHITEHHIITSLNHNR
ncbi:hypothetical protein B0J18DRAFT_138307 [Chaetomium sp. MPI-SDFR-AT-0129]|nr:hypothetical protein B0J18DRAFT_138307 [Chaetomium sp. MPI-SDFR-AT-0129]